MTNIYCVSQELNTVRQFDETEVRDMNEFSLHNYTDVGVVSKGKYKGFKMILNIHFILGSDYISTKNTAEEDILDGAKVGNLMSKTCKEIDKRIESHTDSYGRTVETGGFTHQPSGEIVMNIDYCSNINVIHEACHDLGLKHPKGGGKNGVMHYPPQKMSQEEIDKLSKHSKYLYEIFK